MLGFRDSDIEAENHAIVGGGGVTVTVAIGVNDTETSRVGRLRCTQPPPCARVRTHRRFGTMSKSIVRIEEVQIILTGHRIVIAVQSSCIYFRIINIIRAIVEYLFNRE